MKDRNRDKRKAPPPDVPTTYAFDARDREAMLQLEELEKIYQEVLQENKPPTEEVPVVTHMGKNRVRGTRWSIDRGVYKVESGWTFPCYFRIEKAGRGFVTLRGTGGMTITNAADEVVEAILSICGFVRIFYYDTDGRFDELVHNGKVFTQFVSADGYREECG